VSDARSGRGPSAPAGERLTLASARRSGSTACGEQDAWTSSTPGASTALADTPASMGLEHSRGSRYSESGGPTLVRRRCRFPEPASDAQSPGSRFLCVLRAIGGSNRPVAISHSDQAMYVIGVSAWASVQPGRSKPPTRAVPPRRQRSRCGPVREVGVGESRSGRGDRRSEHSCTSISSRPARVAVLVHRTYTCAHEHRSRHRGWSRDGLGARHRRQRDHRCPLGT
jgi:hypothetical protein